MNWRKIEIASAILLFILGILIWIFKGHIGNAAFENAYEVPVVSCFLLGLFFLKKDRPEKSSSSD